MQSDHQLGRNAMNNAIKHGSRGQKSRGGGQPNLPYGSSNQSGKGPYRGKHQDRPSVEGIYYNARLMHATTSLIGNVVQVVVKDGAAFEGVLRTFSPDCDVVVEMVAPLDLKGQTAGQNIGGLLNSLSAKHQLQDTMIFELKNVVMMNVLNADLDYASRGHFTDGDIVKSSPRDSAVDGKELVPWDDDGAATGVPIDMDRPHNGTGWDAEDMFKTNEVKYAIISSFAENLDGYTVALKKENTEAYRRKSEAAEEVANSINNCDVSRQRLTKENEIEDVSDVLRGPNMNANQQQRVGQPSNQAPKNQGKPHNKITPMASGPPGRGGRGGPQSPNQSAAFNSRSGQGSNQRSPTSLNSPPSNTQQKPMNIRDERGGGGAVAKLPTEANYAKGEPDHPVQSGSASTACSQQPQPQPQPQPQRDSRKNPTKRRESEEELKKFSSDFRLGSKENAVIKEVEVAPKENAPLKGDQPAAEKSEPVSSAAAKEGKETAAPVDGNKAGGHQESVPVEEKVEKESIAKKSTLNPNAKEFNPLAKQFVPRGIPPQQHPNPSPSPYNPPASVTMTMAPNPPLLSHHMSQNHGQMHQQHQHQSQQRMQNPMLAMHQFTPPLQFISNQYIVAPNMAMHSFQHQPNNNNNQRNFRPKGPQQYQNQNNRHDFGQASAHVAAATGHPVLASPHAQGLQVNPYSPSQPQGVPTSGPHQVAYHQPMYSMVHPRMNMVPPQAMGVMPHVPYGDPSGLQHLYMPVQMPLVAQAVAAQQQNNAGPHSAPSTPQGGTPATSMHGGPPTPSPVHHQGPPNQPPTPTPQQAVMFTPHGQGALPPHTGSSTPYGSQQMMPVLMPPHHPHPGQGHVNVHPGLSHNNANPGNHHHPGVPSSQAHVMSASMSLPVIQSSATIVTGPQGTMSSHFGPNPQGRV